MVEERSYYVYILGRLFGVLILAAVMLDKVEDGSEIVINQKKVFLLIIVVWIAMLFLITLFFGNFMYGVYWLIAVLMLVAIALLFK